MPIVFVKVLSGEMITMDILPTITCREFYTRVYQELPVEVKPEYEYQMALMREKCYETEEMTEEDIQREREVALDGDELNPSEEEMFFAIFDTAVYWTEGPSPVSVDIYDRESGNWFGKAIDYAIYRRTSEKERELVYGGKIFNGEQGGYDMWVIDEDIKWEWSNENHHAILLDLPEDEGELCAFPTVEAISQIIFGVKGLSKHVHAYLGEQWLDRALEMLSH